MQNVIQEAGDKNVNAKRQVTSYQKLFVLSAIQKEYDSVQQFVENDVDDSKADTMEVVSITQDVEMKQENVQIDLFKTIDVKEEENITSELVRVYKSEEVLNSDDCVIIDHPGMLNEVEEPRKVKKKEKQKNISELARVNKSDEVLNSDDCVIIDCPGMLNEVEEPRKVKKKEKQKNISELARVNKSDEVLNSDDCVIIDCPGIPTEVVEPRKVKETERRINKELFNAYKINNVSIKGDTSVDCVVDRSELVKLMDVKNTNNIVNELVNEYYQKKIGTNKKRVNIEENKQVDIRKFFYTDSRKEMLKDVGDATASKPESYSHVCPSNVSIRIVDSKQKLVGNNVCSNTVSKDVVRSNLKTIINNEAEKQLPKGNNVKNDGKRLVVIQGLLVEPSEIDSILTKSFLQKNGALPSGKSDVVFQGYFQPVELDSILRESVLAFGDKKTQAAACAEEEKRRSILSDKTNKAMEPIECVSLLDSDDEDVTSKMDESGVEESTTTREMDIEFIDCCSEEENSEKNGDEEFVVSQPTGTSSQVNHLLNTPLYNQKMQHASDFMKCPSKMRGRRGVVNIQNKDMRSFMWAVLAALYPSTHSYRTSSLEMHINKINMCGINYPVSIKSIDIFEKLNPDISVNVFGYEREVYPIRMSMYKGRKKHIYLLMLCGKRNYHYCVVSRISRLLHHLTKSRRTHYYCKYCFQQFVSKNKYMTHEPHCESMPMDINVIIENLKCKKHTPEGYHKKMVSLYH